MEELYEIAMGQKCADDEKGGKITLAERLKAAELLAKMKKDRPDNGSAPAVIIIDDIK